MSYYKGSLLLSVVIIILFLLGSIISSVSIATLANLLDLTHIPLVFADHGQELSLILNSGHFKPLSVDDGNQVTVSVNYTTNNSTIIDNKTRNITAVVQFTDATKTIPISNPVHIRLNLTQPVTDVSEAAIRPEIAAFWP